MGNGIVKGRHSNPGKMETYTVEVTSTETIFYEVEASSSGEALEQVKNGEGFIQCKNTTLRYHHPIIKTWEVS